MRLPCQLPVLPAYTYSQSPVVFACCLIAESIIRHIALGDGLHYVDQRRYLAHAIADEFPAHYDVLDNATLLPAPSRPNQIHAAVMPICLLLLVGRLRQTSHIFRCSSDGSLVVVVLLPKVFSRCGSYRICSTLACYSGDNSAAHTPKLRLDLLLVAVGFAPF